MRRSFLAKGAGFDLTIKDAMGWIDENYTGAYYERIGTSKIADQRSHRLHLLFEAMVDGNPSKMNFPLSGALVSGIFP